ncbi:MAG: hypothetical protein IT446_04560 [Phycisphaerales bacterium]|nr:hypothetical protein [Phycisphaerales bacterium]
MSTKIDTLYLFVHPLHVLGSEADRCMALWRKLLEQERANPHAAVCIISDGHPDTAPLAELANELFGDRCLDDPRDESESTKIQVSDDLDRMFAQRGWNDQWAPYEFWSSRNVRRNAMGILKMMRPRGLEYDPATLRLVACGQQWGGCMAKYPMFIARYMELKQTPQIRADLSPEAGYPHQAQFLEGIELDRHVTLYLFKTPDGRPMAQFIDGLRAIWEQPHVAILPAEATPRIQAVIDSPNANVSARGHPVRWHPDGAIEIDVADGVRPVNVTLFGQGISHEAFRDIVKNARILAINK